MDRKGILIIVATLAIVFGWHFGYYLPAAREAAKRSEEARKKQAEEDAKKPPVAVTPPPTTVTPPAGTPEAVKPPVAEPEERKVVASEVGTVQYVFTNRGGGISRVVLMDHFEDKKNNTRIVLNEFGGTAIGVLAEKPDDPAFTQAPWVMSEDANHDVTFERTVPGKVKGTELGLIKITKKFSLPRKPDESDPRKVKLRSEYLLGLDVTYTNVGETATSVPKSYLHIGGAAPINKNEQRMYQGFDYWREGDTDFKSVDSFAAGGFLLWKHPERPVLAIDTDLIRWTAVTNQYFTTMATVLGGEDKSADERRGNLGVTAWMKRSLVPADDWRQPSEWRPNGHEPAGSTPIYQVDGAMGLPELSLSPKESTTRSFLVYAGPREYRRLRLLDHHESDVLNYGSFLGIPTGMFSRLLLNSMNGLYAWTGSYPLAIILLTMIVKGLLWPLQNRANKNMKKMSALQPEIKRLQDKYKEEPVKFQQEMGKVWKKAGVNPLSGCWPIFIQVPIFIGFYNMLGKAVELRHHGFWWVKDLAAPDTVLTIAGWIPINPLPLIMAGTMFLQMKITPQSGDATQRRIFMFMPLIFIFMCYSFASALALYWTVQNLISIVQLIINQKTAARELKLAAAK